MRNRRIADAELGASDIRVTFRSAVPRDDPTLKPLLFDAGLPFEDIDAGRQEFVVALIDADVVGCVGIERFDPEGLLRSLAVREQHRGLGLGGALFNRIIALARDSGVQRLFS